MADFSMTKPHLYSNNEDGQEEPRNLPVLDQEADLSEENLDPALLALRQVVNDCGQVDLKQMEEASGLPFEELKERLEGNWIIQDPAKTAAENPRYSGWVLLHTYLNGNLTRKKEQLKQGKTQFPDLFEQNERILSHNAPQRVSIKNVSLSLGAPWIPQDLYSQFVTELLEAYEPVPVAFSSKLQSWKIDAKDQDVSYVENTYTYGTSYLSALKIISQTMNAKTVKVYDRKIDGQTGKIKSILNKARTLEAQEKQKKILQAFELWCLSDIHRMDRLENAYNTAFVSWKGCAFDGSMLNLPGLNSEISLYPHQKDAVAKVLFSDSGVLLAHEVGTGKTFEIICSAHELIRMKKAKKVMVTVPNNVFQDIVQAHSLLYPQDTVLSISSKDFVKSKRKKALESIAELEEGVVYLPYSSFDLIKMSKQYEYAKQRKEVMDLRNAKEQTQDRSLRDSLDRKAHTLADKLSKFLTYANEGEMPGFDQLGIDVLFVDEAHNYKNIPLNYKADSIVGMHSAGSAKCREMLDKCRSVKKTVFATGTPLTNSIADLFVLQTYLQPEALEENSIDAFDQWINTFARRETNFEIDVDSAGLRVMTRFSTFHNLSELMSMFSVCCDFHYKDNQGSNIPILDGYSDVTVAKTPTQAEYIAQLGQRTERIRTKSVSRQEDNLLLVTTDGRKCALDARLVGLKPTPAEIAQSKISRCADEIMNVANRNPKTAQLVFSDIGTPKPGFNVYDELKKQLIERGMKAEEIAFIHDAKNEEQRLEVFKKVNEASIRVMIGSTQKLGTGVNVQERLAALHHLSVPWRPADMVQREGRILRQGNTCKRVSIYRYITQGSFDAYSWQLLESKQRFISSFLSGTNKNRTMEDIADSVLSYADVKALAIGNPLIKKRVETGNKMERARTSWQQRINQLTNLKRELKELPERIRQQQTRISLIEQDYALYQSKNGPVSANDRERMGKQILDAFSVHIYEPKDRLVVVYRGFGIYIPKWLEPGERKILLCAGKGRLQYRMPIRTDKAAGISRSLDYLLAHLPDEINRAENTISKLEKDIERAKKEIASGNPYEEEYRKLEQELAEIDAQLEEQEKENESSLSVRSDSGGTVMDPEDNDEYDPDWDADMTGSWIESDSDDFIPFKA